MRRRRLWKSVAAAVLLAVFVLWALAWRQLLAPPESPQRAAISVTNTVGHDTRVGVRAGAGS